MGTSRKTKYEDVDAVWWVEVMMQSMKFSSHRFCVLSKGESKIQFK